MYAGIWMRLMPSDFRVRSLDGVADDWPLAYEDLSPYYDRIERDFGVSGHPGDPAFPDITSLSPEGRADGTAGRMMAAAHDRLGWHWWPGSNAIAPVKYGELNPCVRRGTCLTGCPEGAKSTTDRSRWPEALKLGARLVTGARVRAIETNDAGLATAAVYIDRNGRERRQRGKVIFLCANGVGTPRLLLLSGIVETSRRSCQRVRNGRQASHDASVREHPCVLRGAARFLARALRPAGLLPGVL